ncbi:MAG: TolC family protein [candidate division Zixibacteria bacterium]|nr:TolC family protein [candidate division Zixibacteria bacterium]
MMPFANRKTLMFTGMLLLLSVFVSAETLTLDQSIDLALKNHPNVISAKGNVKTANAGVWNAYGNFLPRVSASGGVSETHGWWYADSLMADPSDYNTGVLNKWYKSSSKNYSLGVSANMTLFNGGQNIFNLLGAKANKSYFNNMSEMTQQDLILEVKRQYFNYLAAIKTKEMREESVKHGEEGLKLAESKFEVGSASKSDVLKAKVQYGLDKINYIDAENAIENARSYLIWMIGLDINSDADFSPEYSTKEYNGIEGDALNFGLSNYPGLLAAENNVSKAKQGVRSAWGRFLPTVGVSLSKTYSNSRWSEVKEFSNYDGSWTIGTTVSLPIFENFSRKYAVSSAKVTLNNARAGLFYEKNNVTRKVKEAFRNMNRSKEMLEVANETEASALEDMSLTQEKYDLGAATILELLDARVSLIRAQNNKIQSEFDYNIAVATLENAMGVR